MIAPVHFSASVQSASGKPDKTDRDVTGREAALHDAGLVLRSKAGDEAAFAEIVARHQEHMYLLAFSMLRNRADAEEIAQDTFIRAHRGLAKFRGDASLATWLHRIALNLARNRYWYFFRRRRHVTFSLDGAFGENQQATFADRVAAEAADPARSAVAGEYAELVADCMERLGAAHREILTMRNSMHRSYVDIGSALGISVGTVKSRIARARGKLRLLLGEACPEFGPDSQPSDWFDPIRPPGGIVVMLT